MSWRTVSCEVDIDDFLSSCGKSDIKYIIDYLVEHGDIEKPSQKNYHKIDDEDWSDGLEKLKINRFKLTNEEEEYINKIIDRIA